MKRLISIAAEVGSAAMDAALLLMLMLFFVFVLALDAPAHDRVQELEDRVKHLEERPYRQNVGKRARECTKALAILSHEMPRTVGFSREIKVSIDVITSVIRNCSQK